MIYPDLRHARIVITSLAPLEWMIIWLSRYIPVPIKNASIRIVVEIAFALCIIGPWFVQVVIYQSIGGIRIPGKDHFFLGLTIIEHGVGIGILYRIAFERRKKERERRTPE